MADEDDIFAAPLASKSHDRLLKPCLLYQRRSNGRMSRGHCHVTFGDRAEAVLSDRLDLYQIQDLLNGGGSTAGLQYLLSGQSCGIISLTCIREPLNTRLTHNLPIPSLILLSILPRVTPPPIMPLRIRLARHGQRNNPYYHIVAIDASKARDARPLEKLGEYDPIPRVPSTSYLPPEAKVFGKEHGTVKLEKKVEWNVKRIRYWLGVGAEPTRTVVKLLERVGILAVLLWVGGADGVWLREEF